MNKDFVERMKVELNKLNLKIGRLENFMVSDRFYNLSEANQIALREQLDIMRKYANILTIRIELNNN